MELKVKLLFECRDLQDFKKQLRDTLRTKKRKRLLKICDKGESWYVYCRVLTAESILEFFNDAKKLFDREYAVERYQKYLKLEFGHDEANQFWRLAIALEIERRIRYASIPDPAGLPLGIQPYKMTIPNLRHDNMGTSNAVFGSAIPQWFYPQGHLYVAGIPPSNIGTIDLGSFDSLNHYLEMVGSNQVSI